MHALTVFCFGMLFGAAVGILIMGALTAHKLTPRVSGREALELARRFEADIPFQRACYNYAARAPGRECFIPAMAAAVDAYFNTEKDLWGKSN